MSIRKLSAGIVFGMALLANTSYAQDRPVGYWRSHLPYNKAMSVATDGTTLFVAAESSFYTINEADGTQETYSKVEGMSDVGLSCLAYDVSTSTTVIAYKNGNIDLFKEGSFFNIPYLKLKTVTGSKNVNSIYTTNGLAYLSTDIGIIVLNLKKREVKESYTFVKNNETIPVISFSEAGNYFFAATPIGLYRTNKNSISLQSFDTWTVLDSIKSYVTLAARNDTVYTATIDTAFAIEGNSTLLKPVFYSDSNIAHINAGVNGVWIIENYDTTFNGKAWKMDGSYSLIDSFKTPGFTNQILEISEEKRWVADIFTGLKRRDNRGDIYNTVLPPGPNAPTGFDIYAYNKEVLVGHGAYDNFYAATYNTNGFSSFNNEKWISYAVNNNYRPFGDSVRDITEILRGPDGNIYAGSNVGGLFVLKPDGNYEIYKQGYFGECFAAPGQYRVSGLAFDTKGNLWVTAFGANSELVVKKKDGTWRSFSISAPRNFPHAAAHLVIDDNDLKWFACPQSGGLMVYDDNSTIDNPADDRFRLLKVGKGVGNLPDNEVYCIAKDKNGAIWVGTGNGIGIINCPTQVIAGTCEAEIRVVQYDEFPGYLFANEIVKALAVDGGNRKWVGTNNGVWLLSPDGDKIIYRYTAENSPLPSNSIQKISIDPITGDVYISTDDGMVSFRSGAVEGGTKNEDVVSFPNPVPSGYDGIIAIKGLVENADVRITDIAGQLVYRTKALGGQAIWNGVDYTGRRPQTGVYLIFVTNKDGSQTHVGKLAFID